MMRILIALCFAVSAASASAQTRQAQLGQCALELGGLIENCRLGYRTFGSLDARRANAILIPTWFASRADAWLPLLGPAGVIDTAGYYVIVVESLGAGSSSSPSTSQTQARQAFPDITVGDMVEASYRLAREHLRLEELHAVVGISLGAMQVFEWGVKYPDFARRLVPIHGAPRLATYGRALWELLTRAVDDGLRGVVPPDSTALTLARFLVVAGSSPAAANRIPDSAYAQFMVNQARQLRTVDLHEWSWQGRAILRHDIARHFGGDFGQAAGVWQARTLIVASTQDHSIDAEPARAFARLIRADTLVVTSAAGHSTIFSDSIAKATVREWLKR